MRVPVELSLSELMLAAIAGVMRRVESLRSGYQQRHGMPPGEEWRRDIEGAIGEKVVAKFRNVYWAGKGRVRDADVDGQQVRFAQPGGRLILHNDDADDEVFWLVCGEGCRFTVEGWMWGREGKQLQWWVDPTGRGRWAYFVPQEKLHDPREMTQEVRDAAPV